MKSEPNRAAYRSRCDREGEGLHEQHLAHADRPFRTQECSCLPGEATGQPARHGNGDDQRHRGESPVEIVGHCGDGQPEEGRDRALVHVRRLVAEEPLGGEEVDRRSPLVPDELLGLIVEDQERLVPEGVDPDLPRPVEPRVGLGVVEVAQPVPAEQIERADGREPHHDEQTDRGAHRGRVTNQRVGARRFDRALRHKLRTAGRR